MLSYFFVLVVGLFAGCVSGIIGTGSSLLLLPILVYVFGPKHAVPIMAVAAVMGNMARVTAWWSRIDWKAVAAYSIPGAPAAALGASTMLALPSSVVEAMLGVFFLAMIPLRRLQARLAWRPALWHLAVAGALIGFLTGLVLSTGPLSVPVFTAYGLSSGAFIATEAASALVLYVSKVATFRQLGAAPLEILLQGSIVGASLMLGTYGGKAILKRMEIHVFNRMLDALMLTSGIALLWTAVR
ncbi:sulfite exporter TauE/SafE family protein [Variovorax sp. J2P1-59]|uniref:sulfite exporter TauE/SafE family protein n=1 Tax=Variovorax flavidus TaxID=3053501 RepID=UPI002574DD04|nr:sulfite exporter TauE/SafE family protein [Variovorax sp. J2P1-59]MDM0075493.1 sulfite exporter TauE/SafE family protein [Variovorax sp. J2P1-59]